MPEPAAQRWLLAAAAVTLLPHLAFLPPGLGAVAVLLLVWHGDRLRRDAPRPPRALMLLLTAAAGGLILLHFETLLGKGAGVALLALLLSLKLLESDGARDLRVAVLLCFFLQLSLFLDTESALTGLGALTGALLATAALASVQLRADVRATLDLATTLMAQALPFMLVLFVLFPRIPGPLWGLPADAYSGRTGLSDSMEPGAISALGQSAEIAFRARFASELPPPALRYWRGPVLSAFDGRRWSRSAVPSADAPAYRPTGPALDYELTLEAHNRNWLLALDYPGPGIDAVRYAADYQLLASQPVRQRTRYVATAFPSAVVGRDEEAAVLAAARALPEQGNPRTRALAASLRAVHDDDAALVQAAIAWMRDAQLIYTLRPPRLERDTADGFLFDTRQGFCEHFAGSFAVLMRAAGVPTRVVTGYQGGEINPFDGTLVVRQSDAHAWAEVWLAGRGWVRIDPTAASAPRRIDSGLAAALPAGEPLPFLVATDLAWLRSARDRWDFVANAWNQWVLGYDQQRQRRLLQQAGLSADDWRQVGAVLLAATGLLFAALLWWAHRNAPVADPLLRRWRRFERKLARAGTPRLPSEGPADYAMRAARRHPAMAAQIHAIARQYATLRYGPRSPDRAALKALASRIDRFRIPRP